MKKLIVTVGPSILKNDFIKNNHHIDYIYRVNGAHGNIKNIEKTINLVRGQVRDAEILLDLPGNKIRTSGIDEPIVVSENESFYLATHQFNFLGFYKYLKIGDIVFANDSTLKFEVNDINDSHINFISHSNGVLENNKGFTVQGVSSQLPHLFEKDLQLIELANKMKVERIGLSFVRTKADVENSKKLLTFSKLIVKIETKAAVENLDDILSSNDFFLIDRGDLSSEIGLINLAQYQEQIIRRAKELDKNIFLATQFLKNMEKYSIPSISEAIDLVNTLKKGIYGIQLSEETAIGLYPLNCLKFINEVRNHVFKD
jgi:pyruvate kinase